VVSCVGAPAICLYGASALVAPVGAILGHVARRRIRAVGAGGQGMALAGIIIGWVATALGLAITGLVVAITNNAFSTST
jgi:hypothetical protein